VLPRLDGQDNADGLREAQEDVLAKIADAWTGPVARPVRLLPQRITAAELVTDPESTAVPIGVAEDDLSTVSIELTGTSPHFLVFGDAGSGKSTMLRTWLTGLCERTSPYDVRVVLVDYRHSLLDVVGEEHLGAYAGDPTTAAAYIQQVCAKLEERRPPAGITKEQLRARDWWEGTELYVVVDDYDLVSGGMTGVLNPLADFIPLSREVGLHVVLARKVSGMARVMGDPLAARLKDMGADGLILSGDRREGAVLGDERAQQRPPGRGVLLKGGRHRRLIQVAVPEAATDLEPADAAF